MPHLSHFASSPQRQFRIGAKSYIWLVMIESSFLLVIFLILSNCQSFSMHPNKKKCFTSFTEISKTRNKNRKHENDRKGINLAEFTKKVRECHSK
ncbi:hypothetical protein B9Z55_000709 [Caenorhabditis nigoni]|uniref:Uncharacterized protein n=1 Tax=Caenorhabditis nigoni TaxID=1611254 RepID=A0A2G5VUD9_9PELO|nr:hypothetical protein B9Z55_000709 [Caenorhabditis nigoni]